MLRFFAGCEQGLLASLGVQTMGLPAAATTIGTWMHGFGFVAMPEEQQRAARSELRILVFPGAAGPPGLAAHRSAVFGGMLVRPQWVLLLCCSF